MESIHQLANNNPTNNDVEETALINKAISLKENNKDNDEDKTYYIEILGKTINYLKYSKYSCLSINIIDIVLIPIFPKIFFNIANVFSIVLIILLIGFCLRIFRKKLQFINNQVYNFVKKILFFIIIVIIIFFIDMIYIIVVKVFLNDFDEDYGFIPIVLCMFYCGINFVFPILIVVFIIQIISIIKCIEFKEGEEYSLEGKRRKLEMNKEKEIKSNLKSG